MAERQNQNPTLLLKFDVLGRKMPKVGSLLLGWSSCQSKFTEKPQCILFSGPYPANEFLELAKKIPVIS